MFAPILQPRRLWLLWHRHSLNTVYLPLLLWIETRAGWDLPKAVTFPPLSCAFVTAWESPCSSAIHITHNKMGLSRDIIAPSIKNV